MRRADAAWHGEDPGSRGLLPEALVRAQEDLAVHAHVRASLMTTRLWTAREVSEFLDVDRKTFARWLAADAGLRALAIRPADAEGETALVRWYAADVVAYLTRRPLPGRREG